MLILDLYSHHYMHSGNICGPAAEGSLLCKPDKPFASSGLVIKGHMNRDEANEKAYHVVLVSTDNVSSKG
jgi:hypothetical protein